MSMKKDNKAKDNKGSGSAASSTSDNSSVTTAKSYNSSNSKSSKCTVEEKSDKKRDTTTLSPPATKKAGLASTSSSTASSATTSTTTTTTATAAATATAGGKKSNGKNETKKDDGGDKISLESNSPRAASTEIVLAGAEESESNKKSDTSAVAEEMDEVDRRFAEAALPPQDPVYHIKELLINASPSLPFPVIDKLARENEGILLTTRYDDGSSLFHIALSKVGFLDPLIIYLFLETLPEPVERFFVSQDGMGITPLHRLAAQVMGAHVCYLHRSGGLGKTYLPVPFWDPLDMFYEVFDIARESRMDLTKVVNRELQTVLNFAISFNKHASYDVVKSFYDDFPALFTIKDVYGQLPVHKLASKHRIDLQTMEVVIKAHPKGLLEQDYLGNVPLHYLACRVDADEAVVALVASAEPKACKKANKNKQVAADIYLSFQNSSTKITGLLSRGKLSVNNDES